MTGIRIPSGRTPAHDMESAISAFLSYCESKNLSRETITFYAHRLRRLAEFTGGSPPREIDTSAIREFALSVRKKQSAMTARHSVQVAKTFFAWLVREGFLESDPAIAVERPKVKSAVIQTLSEPQVAAMLATCGRDFYGLRDKAIILTLLDCGLRASELCALLIEHVSWEDQTFRVLGKGAKERVAPFGRIVRLALKIWLHVRTPDLGAPALFVGHYGAPLDRCRLREIVKRRCERAGVKGVRCSPHTFRHTCAVNYLRAGGDTFTLQKLLGHSSQEMTRRYCETLSAADVQRQHQLHSPVDNMHLPQAKSGRSRLR